MRKTKPLGIVSLSALLILLFAAFTKQSRTEPINKTDNNLILDISDDLFKTDMQFLTHLPTASHWSNIEQSVKRVPINYLRNLDSIDIHQQKDTLFVKIYSQNHANTSKCTYKLTLNSTEQTDSLYLKNFYIDYRLKEYIDHKTSFRAGDFTVDYRIKRNLKDLDKRIIFDKDFK